MWGGVGGREKGEKKKNTPTWVDSHPPPCPQAFCLCSGGGFPLPTPFSQGNPFARQLRSREESEGGREGGRRGRQEGDTHTHTNTLSSALLLSFTCRKPRGSPARAEAADSLSLARSWLFIYRRGSFGRRGAEQEGSPGPTGCSHATGRTRRERPWKGLPSGVVLEKRELI